MKRIYSFARRIHDDSLYKNAIYLMASTFVMAGIGFFFWTICARLYTTEQIGLATTLISLTSLVTNFSLLGFNTAIVRFLPSSKHKSDLINTSFGVITISTVICTVLILYFLPVISPKLAFLHNYQMFELSFIVFMIIASFNAITDSIFIANRKAQYILLVDTIMSLVKLATPIFLVSLGTYGIFYGFLLSVNVSFALSIIFLGLLFGYKLRPRIHLGQVMKMGKFSFGNYTAGLMGMLTGTITPILITNTLGPSMTAYYFMPSMIINLVLTIQRSMSQSMITEGSYTEQNLRNLFFRSTRATYLLLTPLIIMIMFIGPLLLSVFGKSYNTEGIMFLRLSLIAVLFSIPNTFFGTILLIKKKVGLIFILSFLSMLVGLSTTFLFLPYGLFGLGLAGIFGQIIMLFVYSLVVYKKQ